MIRVEPAAEPAGFDATVRQPGLRAIAELIGEKPPRPAGRRFSKVAKSRDKIPADKFPDYWAKSLGELMSAYREICAYSCFRIHVTTGAKSVDHFVAKSRAWDKVYEWSNYRLSCSLMNSRKSDHIDVLDPFEIEDGWFELELVGYQVIPSRMLPPKLRKQVQDTIDRLGLKDFCKRRAEDAEDYLQGEWSYDKLKRESPFVAHELKRQGKLRPGDG